MRTVRPLAVAVVLLVALLATGCGPSADQVVDSHRPAFRVLKAKLSRLAEKAPPQGTVFDQPPAAPLDPPLVLSSEQVVGNAEAVMFESLTSDDAKPQHDLYLDRRFTAAIYWTRDDNHGQRGKPEQMDQSLREVLATRYLVVHRVASAQLPTAVNDRQFTVGRATIEGLVFDLEKQELVASYLVRVQTSDTVQAEVRPEETDAQSLERFAQSSLWENARREIRGKIESVVGGRAPAESLDSRRFDWHRARGSAQ